MKNFKFPALLILVLILVVPTVEYNLRHRFVVTPFVVGACGLAAAGLIGYAFFGKKS